MRGGSVTEQQCKTCARPPGALYRDPQFEYLMSADYPDYENAKKMGLRGPSEIHISLIQAKREI